MKGEMTHTNLVRRRGRLLADDNDAGERQEALLTLVEQEIVRSREICNEKRLVS